MVVVVSNARPSIWCRLGWSASKPPATSRCGHHWVLARSGGRRRVFHAGLRGGRHRLPPLPPSQSPAQPQGQLRRCYCDSLEGPRCGSHEHRSTWEPPRHIAGVTPWSPRDWWLGGLALREAIESSLPALQAHRGSPTVSKMDRSAAYPGLNLTPDSWTAKAWALAELRNELHRFIHVQ